MSNATEGEHGCEHEQLHASNMTRRGAEILKLDYISSSAVRPDLGQLSGIRHPATEED
jgi:hypothetical protein